MTKNKTIISSSLIESEKKWIQTEKLMPMLFLRTDKFEFAVG